MYETILNIHSWWAFLVLFIVLIASLNALAGAFSKRDFTARDLRISLFALIVSHIQLLIGLILFFVSDKTMANVSSMGMGEVMKNSNLRLLVMEHPLMAIIAIVLITIGYSRQKRKVESKKKFNTLAIFYIIAFILMLSRIPYDQWFA